MFSTYLQSFTRVLEQTKASHLERTMDLDQAFQKLVEEFVSRKKQQTVYLIGNGGSSGIVSHSAVDFVNACGYRAQALTDNSMLTCMANDYGYENVFAQPFKTLIQANDVVVAVSSSGTSKNIVNACKEAKQKGAFILTFSGFKTDNDLRQLGDYNLWVDSMDYGQVEIGHALLLHYLTDQLSNQ